MKPRSKENAGASTLDGQTPASATLEGNLVSVSNTLEAYLADYPPVLQVSDCAEITGQAESTIRQLMRENRCPHLKIGRRYICPKNLWIDFLEGRWAV